MRGAILLSLAVAIVTGTLSATATAGLARPTLPVKAAPDSVAGFPCPHNPSSTVDIEACEGRKQLALNRQFNKFTAVLWPLLDRVGQRAFVSAHKAWLVYSSRACEARSRAVVGGTATGVIFADCETKILKARVSEVAEIVRSYCDGRVKTGPYRGCPHS